MTKVGIKRRCDSCLGIEVRVDGLGLACEGWIQEGDFSKFFASMDSTKARLSYTCALAWSGLGKIKFSNVKHAYC